MFRAALRGPFFYKLPIQENGHLASSGAGLNSGRSLNRPVASENNGLVEASGEKYILNLKVHWFFRAKEEMSLKAQQELIKLQKQKGNL